MQHSTTPADRAAVLAELARVRISFPKVELPDRLLEGYLQPPASPQECIFAQTATCVSSDLVTGVSPCQFGGRPVCSECGCIASAALASVARYKLAGVLPVAKVFSLSKRIGDTIGRMNNHSGTVA